MTEQSIKPIPDHYASAGFKPEVTMFHPAEIAVNSLNPRTLGPNWRTNPTIKELADNIRIHGILQPILVRYTDTPPSQGASYEILAGERRYRAAILADLKEIPCIILACNEFEAFEITVIENLHREDLHPIEQARGIRSLLDRGESIDAVASRLGISRSTVIRRAALTNLIQPFQDVAFSGADWCQSWGPAHWELISAFPPETQQTVYDIIAEDNKNYGYDGDLLLVSDLKRVLAHYLRLISTSPWKIPTSECAQCLKRSCRQPELFENFPLPGEGNEKTEINKSDACLDPICWESHLATHIKSEAARIEKKGVKPVFVQAYQRSAPKSILDRLGATENLPTAQSYEKAKASDKNAVPILVVDGSQAGKSYYAVLPDRHQSSAPRESGQAVPLAERREKLQRRRNVMAIEALMYALTCNGVFEEKGAIVLGINPLTESTLHQAVAYFGIRGDSFDLGNSPEEDWKEFSEMSPNKTRVLMEFQLHETFSRMLHQDAVAPVPDTFFARQVATLYGVDFDNLLSIVAKEIPDPKSWATLDEDGTPKSKSTKVHQSPPSPLRPPPTKPSTSTPPAPKEWPPSSSTKTPTPTGPPDKSSYSTATKDGATAPTTPALSSSPASPPSRMHTTPYTPIYVSTPSSIPCGKNSSWRSKKPGRNSKSPSSIKPSIPLRTPNPNDLFRSDPPR